MSDKFKKFDDKDSRSKQSRNRRFSRSSRKKKKNYSSEVERRKERIKEGKLRTQCKSKSLVRASNRKDKSSGKTDKGKEVSSGVELRNKKRLLAKESGLEIRRKAGLKKHSKVIKGTGSSTQSKNPSWWSALQFSRSEEPSECFGYRGAFFVALLLLFLGARDSVMSDGVLLIFTGVMLFRVPKLYSKDRTSNLCIIAFALLCLSSFIPSMPYFFSDWKALAVNGYGLDFGFFHSLRPLISVEGMLIYGALISLYFNMGAWKIKGKGQDKVFSIVALLSLVLVVSAYKLGADPFIIFFAGVKHFSSIANYQENVSLFLFILGIGSIGFCINQFKYKTFAALMGLLASGICYLFLLRSLEVLYANIFLGVSFIALFVWFKKQHSKRVGRIFACISALGLSSILLLNQVTILPLLKNYFELFITQFKGISKVLQAILENGAFFGFGLGTSRGLMPQFNTDYDFINEFALRGTDLLGWIVDFGFIGIVILTIFLGHWVKKNVPNKGGFINRYKPFYLMILLVFAVRFLCYSGSNGVALMLLCLLFFQLASINNQRNKDLLPRFVCRILGGFWILVGFLWLFSSVLNIPLHTDIRSRIALGQASNYIDSFILESRGGDLNTSLIPQFHPAKPFSKARKLIAEDGDPDLIIKALEQGQFLDPNNEQVVLSIGYWALESNPDYALECFYRYFQSNPEEKLHQYKALLNDTLSRQQQFVKLEPLSYFNGAYRVHYLLLLKSVTIEELSPESFKGFAALDSDLKYRFLEHLLKIGYFEIFDEYLELFADHLEDATILKALKAKELADFQGALAIIKGVIEPYPIPLSEAQQASIKQYHFRVFKENFPDISIGAVLLESALSSDDYRGAQRVLEHLLSLDKPPLYAYYWYAEVLYMLKDYEESWFAYETYIQKSKIRNQSIKLINE